MTILSFVVSAAGAAVATQVAVLPRTSAVSPASVGWLLALAAFVLLFRLLFVVTGALFFLLTPGVNVKRLGKWAVVTGATDGIGLAYAQQLAKSGLNVLLISRSREKLTEAAQQISTKYPQVQVDTLQADFSSDDADLYRRIGQRVSSLEVGVLVNNVGISYPHAEYFHLIDDKLVQDLVEVNVNAATQMSRLVVPGMVERKRGAIVNISSAAGLIPTGDPLYAVYSASKAYVDFLSRSLNLELAAKGITVQCQVPYFVVSKMSKLRKATLFAPMPSVWARAAVAAIGKGASVVPYWPHAVQHFVMTALPEFLVSKLVLNHHHGIRKRALAKKDREAAAH